MRWGVRRFQDKHGRLTKAGRKRYNVDESKKAKNGSSQKKGLTDKQKRALKIGAAAVATALVAYGSYRLYKSGKLDPFIEKGRTRVDNLLAGKGIANTKINGFDSVPKQTIKVAVQVDPSTGFKLGAKETVREAVTKVNPSGGNTNCRACSIASILRMRGLDVEALGNVQGGSLREAVEDCFKGAKVAEVYSPSKERVTNYILKRCGEGSSGVMSARYNTPAGKFEHAISWAVKDGAVSFFDGQKSLDDCASYLNNLASDGSAEIARLDNLELNLDGIKKFIKGR